MKAKPDRHIRPAQRSLAIALPLAFWSMTDAWSLPDGEQVVAGDVAIARPAPDNMTIQQDSPAAIVNWKGFSIGAAEQVRIQQPGVSSVILNRVVGNARSDIHGRLSANGKVFLVNPNGVLFGRSATVDVGSLIASTLSISNEDFLAGRYHFSGSGGAVVNAGTINVAERGTAALLGGSVRNDGSISAKLGTVALGAGERMTLDLAGDGLSQLTITQGTLDALVANGNALVADGGQVLLSARAVGELAGNVVNQDGVVQARSLSERDGRIVLDGGETGSTLVSGTIDALGPQPGSRGGEIQVLGHQIGVTGEAVLDASGHAGGGKVLVGGDFQGRNPAVRNAKATYVGPEAALRADAGEAGDGGTVVVWSDDATRAYGSFSARGGAASGNGGLIETSGHYLDVEGARVSASALHGGPGQWLLDPFDIRIVPAVPETPTIEVFLEAETANVEVGEVGGEVTFAAVDTPATVADADIVTALNSGTNVRVQTSADIEDLTDEAGDLSMDGEAAILYSGATSVNLTLAAFRDIRIEPGARIEAVGPGAVAVSLNADMANAGSGSIQVTGASIDTNGGTLRLYGQSDPVKGFALGRQDGDLALPGVEISDSTISTGSGDISIRGDGREGFGGVFLLSFESPNEIESAGGRVEIVGLGGSGGSGVGVDAVDTIIIGGGGVDIRGRGSVGEEAGAPGIHLDFGTLVNAGAGSLRLTGDSASGFAPGLELGGATLGEVAEGGEILQSGDIILRARNTGAADSVKLYDDSEGITPAQIRTTGTLAMLPGGLSTDGAEVVSADAIPIGVGTANGSGFELDPDDLSAIDPATGSIVIGSDTHTGAIGVETSELTLTSNLTLQNEGPGSGGIAFDSGLSLPGSRLTLATVGPLLSSGALVANELLVRGGAGTVVSLTDPANNVNRLAIDPPASFVFVNEGPVEIGPVTSFGFSTAEDAVQPLSVADSSSSGDFLVRTLSGPIVLRQNISTLDPGSDITLVAASIFSNSGGVLTPGAGGRWRIWADTWEGETRGGLAATTPQPNFYGCTFGAATCSSGVSIPEEGNRFIYAQRPSVSVVADDQRRLYGAANPLFSFAPESELENDDTTSDILSGSLGTTAGPASPVGTYAIDNAAGGLSSPVGYAVEVTPGILTVDPATLTIIANSANRPVGQPNPPLTGTVAGFLLEDTLESATEGTLGFSTEATRDTPPGRYAITGSGLTAQNYVFKPAPGNATALTITPIIDVGPEQASVLRPATETTYLYDRNLGLPAMCVATGPLTAETAVHGDDILSLEWSRVRLRPNLSNCVDVSESNPCSDF